MWFLRILTGKFSGQLFPLKEGKNTIGRDSSCSIQFLISFNRNNINKNKTNNNSPEINKNKISYNNFGYPIYRDRQNKK